MILFCAVLYKWTFLLSPSQECTIYFIIVSGMKRYVDGAGEKDAAF